MQAARELERLAQRIRHDARPHWLADATELERVARVHRSRAAEMTPTRTEATT